MTVNVDVAALARLARLAISDEEKVRLEAELPGILSFVETIQSVATDIPHEDPALRNVLREDTDPIEAGTFTEKILAAAPSRVGDRIAVKQVISKKK